MNEVISIKSDGLISNDYLNIMSKYPVLSEKEEYSLSEDWYLHGNQDSAQKLVFSNLKGVVYLANNYYGYGLALMDLVQEGTIGLMKAVKSYNPYKNVRLFAYAIPWIKSEIQNYIIKNWKLVKAATTDSRKKLFFNVRSLKSKLLKFNNAEQIKFISNELNVPEKDVIEMDAYMSHPDSCIDESFDVPSNETPLTLLLEKEEDYRQSNIIELLDHLNDREREIIKYRFLDDPPKTLHEISGIYNVSLERIRQIEKNALSKLKGMAISL